MRARERDSLVVGRERAQQRERREALLRAAMTVIRREGAAASVAQMAAEAGIGISSFYRSFASKDALLDELVRERIEAWQRIWAGALSGDPRRSLRAALWEVSELQQGEPTVGAVLRDRTLDRPELLRDVRRITEAVLERAQQAGAIRGDLEWNDFTQFFLLLSALPRDDDVLWRRMLTIFIDGLEPGTATPLPRSSLVADARHHPMEQHAQRSGEDSASVSRAQSADRRSFGRPSSQW